MKKILSVLLATLMFITSVACLPYSAFAEEPECTGGGAHQYELREKRVFNCVVGGHEDEYMCAICDYIKEGDPIAPTGDHNFQFDEEEEILKCINCGTVKMIFDQLEGTCRNINQIVSYGNALTKLDIEQELGEPAYFDTASGYWQDYDSENDAWSNATGTFKCGTYRFVCQIRLDDTGYGKKQGDFASTVSVKVNDVAWSVGKTNDLGDKAYADIYSPSYVVKHDYSSDVTKPVSCTEDGTIKYTCTRCGDTYSETISALGHNYEILPVVNASCTSTGLTEGKKCTICGDVAVAQQIKPMLAHKFNGVYCVVCGTGDPSYVPSSLPTENQNTSNNTAPIVKPVAKPKATTIKKLTPGKKQFKASWKKISGVKGYQIQYATNSKFTKGKKTVTIKKQTTSATVKKLKSKKKYYVRIRSYKVVKGKNVYSSWSKTKAVKTK